MGRGCYTKYLANIRRGAHIELNTGPKTIRYAFRTYCRDGQALPIIFRSFIWMHTPEGADFWEEMDDAWRETYFDIKTQNYEYEEKTKSNM